MRPLSPAPSKLRASLVTHVAARPPVLTTVSSRETIGAASHLCPDALGCDSARLPEGVWAMFVMSVRMFLLAVVVFALVALGFLIATA